MNKSLLTDRRLLIIAPPGSYRLTPYIKAAHKLGLIPQIASTTEHAILPRNVEGFHLELDQPDKALEQVMQQAEDIPYAGIIGSDDTTIELAATVADKLGLPHNPVMAAKLTQRKDLARQHLFKAGLNIPVNTRFEIGQPVESVMEHLSYPVVIKPLSLSASRGVIRVNNKTEFEQAVEKIKPLLVNTGDDDSKKYLLAEEYIDGFEIAIDAMLHQQQIHVLAVFDKPDPLTGPYFEETYYITPSRLPPDVQQAAIDQTLAACNSYGLTTGPVHAELRIDKNNKPWILEVASRTIGGDCGQSIKPSASHNLEDLVVSYAIGEPIEIEPAKHSSGVLMIPATKPGILKRVEGLSNARKTEYITDVSIDIPYGNEVQTLPESSSYPGFIFAEADKPEQVEQALREAHEKLDFIISPIWSIQACPEN